MSYYLWHSLMGIIMNKSPYFSIIAMVLLLGACSSQPYSGVAPTTQALSEDKAERRPPPLSDREIRNITYLEDSFYSGNFGDVIHVVNEKSEAKTGSLSYINEALKLKAFSECVEQSAEKCAESFRRILRNQPDFELSEAELTHPIWGPIFQAEKNRVVNNKVDAAIQAVNSMNAHFMNFPPAEEQKVNK